MLRVTLLLGGRPIALAAVLQATPLLGRARAADVLRVLWLLGRPIALAAEPQALLLLVLAA